LVGAAITDGSQQIMLFSNEGKAIRFPEDKVRAMGRVAKGVRGMRVTLANQWDSELDEDADDVVAEDDGDDSNSDIISRVVSLVVVPESGQVLTACANGYGKRTPVTDFPTKNRGGKGIIAVKTSARNGELVKAVAVDDDKELLLISDGGTLIRTPAVGVSVTGRNAQGVMLMRISAEEQLVGVVCVDAVGDDLEVVEDVELAATHEEVMTDTASVAE
jgi:DNA gyrase subunit A